MKRMGLLNSRLEESSSGPARKYYTLTDKGRKRLATDTEQWSRVIDAMRAIGVATRTMAPDAVPTGGAA